MKFEFLYTTFTRLLFFAALIMLGIASVEIVLNFFGFTFLRGISAGRLVELAAAFMVFVIAVLLRQIRDAQKPL